MMTRPRQVNPIGVGCSLPAAWVGSAGSEETDVTLLAGIYQLVLVVINLLIWALILAAVFSMLTAFGVLDTRNRLVWTIGDFLYRVTEPMLRPIRNILPSFGGIDLSPLVAILLLQYIAVPLVRTIFGGIATGVWSFY